jgi:Tfp pilus assembly protein PilO
MSRADQKQLRLWSLGLHAAGLGATLAIALVTLAVGVLPAKLTERRLRASIERDLDFAANEPVIRAQHESLREKLAALERRHQRLWDRIPAQPLVPEFLGQLTELAGEAELSISEFQPGKTIRHKKYGELEIQLRTAGTYQQLCRFVAGFPTLPRACRVRSLNIEVSELDSDTFPTEMTLAIYFAPRVAQNGVRNRLHAPTPSTPAPAIP